MDRNGYFQISKKDDGVYLTVVPSQGEGKNATVEELVTYLDKKQIKYDRLKNRKCLRYCDADGREGCR